MRMKVVLPLPLGPRKPKISPRAHLQIDVIDDGAVAEPLGHAAHVDGEFAQASASRVKLHIHRLARDAASPPIAGSKTASIMKTSLPRLSWL